jgi:hypothetical protein
LPNNLPAPGLLLKRPLKNPPVKKRRKLKPPPLMLNPQEEEDSPRKAKKPENPKEETEHDYRIY